MATISKLIQIGGEPIELVEGNSGQGLRWVAEVGSLSSDVTFPTILPELEIARNTDIGNVSAKNVYIHGSRSLGWTSTSILGDACDYLDTSQALMNTPTVGQTLYIVSTSANDTAGGTGSRSVRIVYLDAAGAQQVVTATMNGTTPVSLGSGFTFIQWMEVASTGSNEVSVGSLSITSTNGAATTATTFERISAGGNRSLSGRYKVPTGWTAYISRWGAASIANTMDTRIRADVFADDRTLSSGVYHFQDRVFLASGQNFDAELSYLKCPSGAVIKISAIPGGAQAGNKLDCSFKLILLNE